MSQDTDATRPDAITQRIIQHQAVRHAAEEGGTTTLEAILARISAEVTKQAAKKNDDKDASRWIFLRSWKSAHLISMLGGTGTWEIGAIQPA